VMVEKPKGTQDRSPNASIYPNPSVVISIVVKIDLWVGG